MLLRDFVAIFLLMPRNFAIMMLRFYQNTISLLYGNVCKYYPSCSQYALEAYQQRAFVIATGFTVWRLLRCNPFSSGGVDHVKPAKRPKTKLTPGGFVQPGSRKA